MDTEVSETGTDGDREEEGEGDSTTEEGEEEDEEEDSRDRPRQENSLTRKLIPTWRGLRGSSTKKLMIT